MTVLITADELRERLAAVVLLDVRWALGRADGHQRYLGGHLPRAVYVDLDTELAAPPTAADGRHPLPQPARLQAAIRRWGVRAESTVVAYDDNANLAAARAWWLLRWAGHREAYLLDGGLQAWTAGGGGLSTDDVRPAPGDAVVRPGQMPTLTADEAAACPLLLDARAPERFRGEVEPVDPVAGHIPGAVNAPTGDNLDDRGRFRPPGELRRRFEALGVSPGAQVGVYCGSGVTAAHEVAALEHAGLPAALYAGSWSQWSNDPSRPVATGPS